MAPRFEMAEFVSQKTFNLNFEDKSPSVKIREGDTLKYDGETVILTTKQGETVEGKTAHLNGAIRTGWIIKKDGSEVTPDDQNKDPHKTYDPKTGGDFDVWAKKNLASAPEPKFDKSILPENERTVKTLGGDAEDKKVEGGKLEVAGDQVAVKEVPQNLVTSSTSSLTSKKHTTQILQSDQVGAERSIEMKNLPKKEASERESKSFTVDETTTALPEDTTLKDVAKAKKSATRKTATKRTGKMEVVSDGGGQDAEVVGQIKRPQIEQTSEGVTLKTSTEAPKEMKITTTTGSGSTEVADPGQDDAVVVAKTAAAKSDEDYLSKLPDGWSELHWTRKEKFIKTLDDPDFVKFILALSTLKAVKAACKKRLEQLEQSSDG